MLIYSLPYFFLIFIYLLLYLYEKNGITPEKTLKVRFIAAFIFILFFGFRGYIGSDWFNYNAYYSEATLSSWTSQDYELGFSFVAKLLHDIGFSFEYFVLIITIFQTFLFDRFLKNESKNVSLGYVILICIFPLLIIDLLRNFTAILIAVQSIDFLRRNKKLKAILIIIASVFFHATGVTFFILFLLKNRYFKRRTVVVFLLVGIVIYLLQIRYIDYIILTIGDLLGGRFQYLAGTVLKSDEGYGIRFGILEKIILMIIVLLNYNNIVSSKIISPVLLNSFFCYCLIQLYFSAYDSIINRFALLFFWAYLIILSNVKIIVKNSTAGNISLIFVIFLCLFKIIATFSTDLYRYTNNIFEKDSYETRAILRNEHYKYAE
ncbi:MAG: EpsG family protein [Flavobacterium sp.]|nr:MAG: EpsG family protein [Flavobacterium sp.]